MTHDSQDASAVAEEIFNVNLTPERIARFWSKIEKPEKGCWLWPGAKIPRGYGTWSLKRKNPRKTVTVYAHRAAFFLSRGRMRKSDFICHHCDNPSCVRPDHLFAGSHGDNMADMVSKGRSTAGDKHPLRAHPEYNPRGEERPNSKVTEDQVREIRRLCAEGNSQEKVGRMFGIAQTTVGAMVRRKKWKHVR